MREILFKAKRKDNGEWVEGCLIADELSNAAFIGYAFGTNNGILHDTDLVEVDPETVCQYTGLIDSNGKKVFEGDILEFEDKANKIKWRGVILFGNPNKEYTWGWQIKQVSGDDVNTDILLWFDMEECGVYSKVVGNIHDEEGNHG